MDTQEQGNGGGPKSSTLQGKQRRADLNRKHAQLAGVSGHPCYEQHQASLRCLADHNYSQDACADHFAAYRDCQREQKEKQKKSLF